MREEIGDVYRASGFEISDGPVPASFRAERPAGAGLPALEIVVSLPLERHPRPQADDVVGEVSAWRAGGGHGLYVVALPKSLSLGAEFQSRIKQAGAELRHYSGLLDGGYGGGYVGLGDAAADVATGRIRDRLVNYSRVDADLLTAVLRPNLSATVLRDAPTRVQQRYFIRDGISAESRRPVEGADLLHHLIARLGQPAGGPEVFLIVGPGGSGKSWLFEGLYTYLYEAFQRRKQQQEPGVRPIAVMPESLIEAGSRDASDLFEAVARTEFGQRGGMGLLDHLVRRGQLILMFDGLDEFFADNTSLADAINARYCGPESRARVFIVLRDSLLETSASVRELIQRFQRELGPESFGIYEIALWETAVAQRELAWLKFERRRPRPGEADTPAVSGFLDWLGQSPRMRDLARIAFYCDLLADIYRQQDSGAYVEERTGRQMPHDEFDLLELCFDLIVDRELAKQRPDDAVVPELAFEAPEHRDRVEARLAVASFALGFGAASSSSLDALFAAQAGDGDPHLSWGRMGLVKVIEEAAYLARRRSTEGPLSGSALRELYAKLNLGGADDDRILGERMLRQFVLFVQGRVPGTVDFSHEFMADFLAARHVASLVRESKGTVTRLAGSPVAGETPVFAGYLRRERLLR